MADSSKITHLPHIKNIKSGINKWDPNHSAIFEVYFTLPDAIKSQFSEDEAILTEQVTKVGGLDALNKTTAFGQQKFMGVDASYHNPTLDNTYCEFDITLNLNLRNVVDNFVFKVFKAWTALNYNLADGTRTLKGDYTSDSVRIAEANRDGTVWRTVVFHHVLLGEITGLGELDYNNNEARQLQCKFRADFWDEAIA